MTDTVELTEAQKEKRRTQASMAITEALTETWDEWRPRRDRRTPDLDLAAGIVMDRLGDLAAEILGDGTMLRALKVENGVTTLELEPATEILKVFVASMRGVLDGYGAENYVEMEMDAPKVPMDLRDGSNPMDSYTVTIQRREGITPHQFRVRAEAERDDALHIVAEWCVETANTDGGAPDAATDLMLRLENAGHTVPTGEVA